MTAYKQVTLSPKREYLRSDAADSIQRAVTYGNFPLGLNDAYRSDAEQEDLFYANYTSVYAASSTLDKRTYNGKAYWRRSPYLGHVSVAIPKSPQANHRTGIAIDIPASGRTWMKKYGAFYGWTNPAWAKKAATFEPWHWEYNPNTDQSKKYWSDMPARKYLSRDADQKLTKNAWTTVRMNDKGDISVVLGAAKYDVDVIVGLSCPATTRVRARFYKVDGASGKRTYTYDKETTVDSPQAKGKSLRFALRAKGQCSPNERVRCEIYTWDDDVTITRASSRADLY